MGKSRRWESTTRNPGKNLSYRPIKTTSVLCIYNVFTITSMIGMIGFTSYGEMIFHSNFLASGGNSVQNIMSKTMPIQKNALKIN